MKKLAFFLGTMALLWSCSTPKAQVTITNLSDYDVTEKPIIIERAQLEDKIANSGQLPFLREKSSSQLVPCQPDDLNGDGIWDELFVLLDLKAKENKTFDLVWMKPSKAPVVKVRTNVRFADSADQPKELTEAVRLESNSTEISQQYFQFEGPGWENDVVGFRNYFDARNGIDIWGKVSHEMVLDRIGLKGGPTYHEMQEWGMDILKVANSLGAGAIALQTANGLYRVGPGSQGTYKLVTEGPLRSIIDFDFKEMIVDGMPFDIKHRVSIVAGKPWYQSTVSISGDASPRLVTGIVNLHSDSVYSASDGIFSYMYTHDNQAYDGEKLGMAIILPQASIQFFTAPEEGEGITQTFYTTMETGAQPNVFYFMAGWEKQDSRWAEKKDFETGVIEQGRQIMAEIQVNIQ